MSHDRGSQGQSIYLPIRITTEIDDQLANLAARWAATLTVKTRVGKATIAKEAMLRGMKLIERELVVTESLMAQKAYEEGKDAG